MAGQKTRGPKPKSDKGAATAVLTMRLRPEIYEALRKDADRNSRSIAAEAERRLVYPEPSADDVGRIVGAAIKAVEDRVGKAWPEDESAKRQCRAAAEFALDVLLGSPVDESRLHSAIEMQIDLLKRQQAGEPPNLLFGVPDADKIEEMIGVMHDWLRGQNAASLVLQTIMERSE